MTSEWLILQLKLLENDKDLIIVVNVTCVFRMSYFELCPANLTPTILFVPCISCDSVIFSKDIGLFNHC